MATIQRSPPLEIRHEPQQSHDSGAYIDWNSESGSPTRKNSGSEVEVSVPGKVVSEEFVTVVSVEGDGSTGAVVVVADDDANKKSAASVGESTVSHVEVPFVTVLSVGGDAPVVSSESTEEKLALSLDVSGKEATKEVNEVLMKKAEKNTMTALLTDGEEVLVYRLPGERLGFGLKFEGGTKTAERVRRLFIQSCAAESPASRARCSWGGLGEGDEVLEIDTVPVNLMTRLDCVRRLKESGLVITLRVRPAPGRITPMVVEAEPPSEPPPVPPRKGQRRASAPKVEEAPPPPVGFGDEGVSNGQRRRASEGDAVAVALSMRQRAPLSPGPIGRNRFSPEHPIPPEAETYIDLLAQEEYAARNCESESDDTGSSISTVVDRLSLNSVSALSSASSENRSPEHGPYGSTIDLARVLDPFERLEREFSSDSEFIQARHTVTSIMTETRVINGDLIGKTEKETSPVAVAINVPAATGLEDDLALQPPPSFQDIPLDEGDGQSIRSSQSSGSTEHETSTEERQDAPRLPPKPAPRKEGHRFRSGKKRPPPPPPPPPSRVEQQTWQTPEEKEVPTVEKQEKVIDAIVEKDILPMDEIDLSPERVEEEIEKVVEMLRNEGREGRLLDEAIEETMEVTIVGGIEKEISIKIVEDILEDEERDAVEKELADEVIVRDMKVEGVDNKEEDDDEDEGEEEEEVEEDDEDDDLMIDSRLSEELWKSGPTDVLFPHFHWSVTQLATIGEDEEEQTDSDNR
ncbi:hypothetical protein J437_LFUL003695 [Ladona fulva]|uniref:PDZ domain-containing protein n=1 Tax=Ladona fulva TaxID=123851 RepID=A0A8K0JWZ1_LADFU|nr:hypothetical protein J437_LFUL003695 [Ladona fulva]